MPNLGKQTEIIVVDDGSNDKTSEIVRKLQKKHKNLKLITYRQNKGKGNAVKFGMDKATGDILVILDADMTVAPEDLPKFIKPLANGRGRFANGTRLTTKIEKGAMGKLNFIGNKIMPLIFSAVLKQKVTDTLCGTKALFKNDYRQISISPDDPWGDFSLLFGAAKLKLKIIEVPVYYKRRIAGKSKMRFFHHSVKLLKIFSRQYIEYLRSNQKLWSL